MITVTITKYVAGGIGPWTYSLADTSGQDCVSFTPASGTSDEFGKIQFQVSFPNDACRESASIVLTVVSQDDCTQNFAIAVANPCLNFEISPISVNDFTFSVVASPITDTYEYLWNYDPTVFELSDPQADTNNPFISLSLVSPNTLPESTPISVIVKNSSGCTEFTNINYIFTRPIAYDLSTALVCLPDGSRQNNSIYLNVQSSSALDWKTLSFGPTSANIGIEHPFAAIPSGTPFAIAENWIKLSAPANLAAGTYQLSYSVKDVLGIRSNTGTITVEVAECEAQAQIYFKDKTYQMDASGKLATDTIEIDISNHPVPAENVDWNSLKFKDSGTQQSATVLGEANGYDDVANPNVVYSAAHKKITYELPVNAGPGICDCFQFSLEDTEGNVSNEPAYFVLLDYQIAPTAVADTETVACNGSVTIDLLANDNANGSDFDPNTLTITEQPSVGTLNVVGDGTVVYYAPESYSGTVTFKYTVSNNNGGDSGETGTSNEATVTIQIICSGESVVVTTCQ